MLKICLFFLFLSLSLGQTDYCVSGPTSLIDTTLYQVRLVGDTTTINDPSQACPGGNGYLNVKDLTLLLADLTAGNTYQISYNVSSCGNVFPVLSGAWIDYNSNNNFYDPGEQLFAFSNLFGFQTWSFTVPLTSLLGNTRLRVQVQEVGSQVDTIDPCVQFSYGGTTDFSVSIKPSGPEYCPTGPTTGDDMNLGPVHMEGFTENIHEDSDCPGVIGGADLTALIADVNPGSSYTLHYKVTDCDPDTLPWATLSGAWIDYNQNTDFEDWELLGISQQSEVADVTLVFTVPKTTQTQEVKTGNTRMRVQVQETNAEVLDSCAVFAWGGTKDFTIRVLESLTYCESGPTSPADTTLASISIVGQDSINDPAGCSVMQIGPVDHTNLVADVVSQTPTTISWNIVTCGRATPTMSAAWADYNHNEVFESWEQITPRFSTTTISTSFKVPPSSGNQVVVGGPTRVRVQAQETTVNAALDPCAQFVGGSTIDLTINIIIPAEAAKTNATNTYGGRGHYSRIGALKV